MTAMIEGEMNGERLSEVSRLAGVLADEVLRESMIGAASMTKLTALGKAALLLQDYDRPVPDLVVDVLTRATREVDGTDHQGATAAEDAERDLAEGDFADEDLAEGSEDGEARRRLLPRLIQSLRLPRG